VQARLSAMAYYSTTDI